MEVLSGFFFLFFFFIRTGDSRGSSHGAPFGRVESSTGSSRCLLLFPYLTPSCRLPALLPLDPSSVDIVPISRKKNFGDFGGGLAILELRNRFFVGFSGNSCAFRGNLVLIDTHCLVVNDSA